MEALMEILENLHPEIDFNTCETLIDDGLIDGHDVLRAHGGAQLTSLAPVRVEGYLGCHV